MEKTTPSQAQDTYVLTSLNEAAGTYLYAETLLVPAAVVRRFGKSGHSEDGKVSGQWVFRKGDLIFTLYDWKSTDLYERGMWTPDELWSSKEHFDLHIGSREPATREDALDFADYLQNLTTEKEQS